MSKQTKREFYFANQVDACIMVARSLEETLGKAIKFGLVDRVEDRTTMQVRRILQPLVWRHSKTLGYIKECVTCDEIWLSKR